jgi:chitinase
LANDLRVDGIDLVYEEIWHADKFAVLWNGTPSTFEIINAILNQTDINYNTIMQYGADSERYLLYPRNKSSTPLMMP